MPIVIKHLLTSTNQPVTFKFGANVLQYVVGISYWNFVFSGDYPFGGGPDHHVGRLGLRITHSKDAQEVTCTVAGNLDDDHGASINHAKSSVRLVCIAVTGSEVPGLAMTQIDGVQSGSLGGPFSLPSMSRSIEAGLLNGWNLQYVGDDHHMKMLQLGAGLVADGTTGRLQAQARMADDTGKSANGTVDGALLATSTSVGALVSRRVPQGQNRGPISIDFGRRIKTAGVLLQNISLAFSGDDHHIRQIGGGVSDWTDDGGSILTLNDAYAFMSDSSGHNQSDSPGASYINAVALAVVAS